MAYAFYLRCLLLHPGTLCPLWWQSASTYWYHKEFSKFNKNPSFLWLLFKFERSKSVITSIFFFCLTIQHKPRAQNAPKAVLFNALLPFAESSTRLIVKENKIDSQELNLVPPLRKRRASQPANLLYCRPSRRSLPSYSHPIFHQNKASVSLPFILVRYSKQRRAGYW